MMTLVPRWRGPLIPFEPFKPTLAATEQTVDVHAGLCESTQLCKSTPLCTGVNLNPPEGLP